MTSFVVSGTGSVTQTLTDGQNGFVTTFGTIYVEAASAVVMSGHSDLTVMGTVASATASAVVLGGSTASSNITIGAAGSIIAGDNLFNAITGQFGALLNIRDAGLIAGGSGINVSSTTANAKFILENSGDIEGAGSANAIAVEVSLAASGVATISNSGIISETGSNVAIDSAGQGSLTL